MSFEDDSLYRLKVRVQFIIEVCVGYQAKTHIASFSKTLFQLLI